MLILNSDTMTAVNNGLDIPKTIIVNGQRAIKIKWVSSSGWRGYFESESYKKYGWEKIDSSWVTGNWDDAPAGHAEADVFESLNELAKREEKNGNDILVIFMPTSNLFSTGYDVFKRKRETIKKKKIANNTWFIDYGKRRAIRLHATDILIESRGIITINNGGWDTVTTRERINRYLPAGHRIYRDKGKTYLDGKLFKNGMKVKGVIVI